MTATDELRRLLDERGVEWDAFSVSNTEYTHWMDKDGHWCAASIGGPLSLHVNILSATPAQAIAATFGNERERELESLAADMFNWLADYITPEQYAMWEVRLEELDVEPTWRWTR